MEAASGAPRVAVVLAAGKGTRMRSALPKVLHPAAGRPLLAWVLDAARAVGCERILVVVGHGAEQVRAAFAGEGAEGESSGHHGGLRDLAAGEAGERHGDLAWVVQAEQRGTGHALAQAARLIDGPAQLLVLSGDVPLVTAATLERLLAAAAGGWGAMAVADLAAPGALGRVIAKAAGSAERAGGAAGGREGERPRAGAGAQPAELLERIVEAADARPAELAVTLVNAGLYVLPAPEVFAYLAALAPANAQGELYLTDALNAAAAAGRRIELVRLADPHEALGVNDRRELAAVHRRLLDRHLDGLMLAGVAVLEPARTVAEATVCVGPDTVLHPDVSLLGRTEVGPFARLGTASQLLPGGRAGSARPLARPTAGGPRWTAGIPRRAPPEGGSARPLARPTSPEGDNLEQGEG